MQPQRRSAGDTPPPAVRRLARSTAAFSLLPPSTCQVTLFRVHKHFITPEAHYWRQKYKLGDSAGGRAGNGRPLEVVTDQA